MMAMELVIDTVGFGDSSNEAVNDLVSICATVAFCKGMMSSHSTSPHSTRAPTNNCKAQNDDPNAQAMKRCTAMKEKGIIIYPVSINSGSSGASTLPQSATGTQQSYTIEGDDALEDRLVAIPLKLRDVPTSATAPHTSPEKRVSAGAID